MELGLFGVLTDETIPVSVLAQEAEDRGFDAIFIGEHAHTPVVGKFPEWMAQKDQGFPEYYRRYPDPFVSLAHASALTSRLKLGISISLVAIHDPIILAKTVATLDYVSGGRVIFGMGYGYNEPEFRNHRIDVSLRRDIAREKILAMERLWSQETASYEGTYVSFTESWQYPKPLQQPRPPVLVGGALIPKTLDHIAEFADGWLPNLMMTKGKLASDIVRLREHLEAAGRDPADLDITVQHMAENHKERNWDYRVGMKPVTYDLIDYYEAMGVTRVLFPVPTEPTSEVLRQLDDYVNAIGDRLTVV